MMLRSVNKSNYHAVKKSNKSFWLLKTVLLIKIPAINFNSDESSVSVICFLTISFSVNFQLKNICLKRKSFLASK
jgi:hypothetical protein